MEKLPNLESYMLEKHGPLMGGPELYRALGFGSYSAFHRAVAAGSVGIRVFKLNGRKGLFATTLDVAQWVNAQTKNIVAQYCDDDAQSPGEEEGMR